MTQNEAKERIREHFTAGLAMAGDGKSRICPICGSGSGKKGTGITTKDGGRHWTCWRGCFTNSDAIDIIAKRDGMEGESFPKKFGHACQTAGINPEDVEKYSGLDPKKDFFPLEGEAGSTQRGRTQGTAKEPPITNPAPPEDFTAYYAECAARRKQSLYLVNRGISYGTQERFNIGYDPAFISPAAKAKGAKVPPTPRAIIPTSSTSFLARLAREPKDDIERKYAKQKQGAAHFFNWSAVMQTEKPVIVVEGEIDAMSLEEIGFSAVALGSTSNAGKFAGRLKTTPSGKFPPLLICLDHDDAGQRAQFSLLDDLKTASIPSIGVNVVPGELNDVNEGLVGMGKAQYKAFVTQAVEAALNELQRAADEVQFAYTSKNNAIQAAIDLIGEIEANKGVPYIPTGFKDIDYALDGGLYPGLYIVGAIPSLGKTTLCLQIADHIARGGRDVLIISLEMSRRELIGKSFSRLTYEKCEAFGGEESAQTYRGITNGNIRKRFTKEQNECLDEAMGDYLEHIAPFVYIWEGMGDIDASGVRDIVQKHMAATRADVPPVVVVDYMQILKPYRDPENPNRSLTDKQAVDASVSELKRISRDYDLTMIAVSSFNRNNYNEKANMTAFKESGGIEYASDVVIGLQLVGTGSKDFDVDAAKEKTPRDVEAIILKNRNGRTGRKIYFDYYAAYNYFRPSMLQQEERERKRQDAAEKAAREKLDRERAKWKTKTAEAITIPPERKKYIAELKRDCYKAGYTRTTITKDDGTHIIRITTPDGRESMDILLEEWQLVRAANEEPKPVQGELDAPIAWDEPIEAE